MAKHRSATVARHRAANGRVHTAPPPRHRVTGQERTLPGWLEMVLLLAVALVLSLAIKTWFVQMFFVPSESMEPLLLIDDRIMVQKVSYWGAGHVERGDVVVFEDPGGWLQDTEEPTGPRKLLAMVGLYPTGGHLVKRVIGVGGDTVACCDKEGRVTVNGVALNESPYLPPGVDPSDSEFTVHVPEGRIWLMGDNRSNSEDSRFHRDLPGDGTVAVDRVVGKVWAIVWPLRHLDHLTTPKTFDQDFDGSSS